jgi:hypothetical protein
MKLFDWAQAALCCLALGWIASDAFALDDECASMVDAQTWTVTDCDVTCTTPQGQGTCEEITYDTESYVKYYTWDLITASWKYAGIWDPDTLTTCACVVRDEHDEIIIVIVDLCCDVAIGKKGAQTRLVTIGDCATCEPPRSGVCTAHGTYREAVAVCD